MNDDKSTGRCWALALLAVLCLPAVSNASLWLKQFGNSSHDVGKSVAVDANNNTFSLGTFSGQDSNGNSTPVDFSAGAGAALTSNGSADIYLVKHTAAGAYQWSLAMGSLVGETPGGLATDSNGNVFVTGFFYGTMVFPAPCASLVSVGSSDAFLAKFSSAGACVSAVKIGGSGADAGYSVAVDGSSGNVYLLGSFNGAVNFGPSGTLTSAGFADVFVQQFTNSLVAGSAAKGGGVNDDTPQGISIDPTGKVAIVGFFAGPASFGTVNLTNAGPAGTQDIFLIKYGAFPSVLWAKSIGGPGSDFGNAVTSDSQGNVIVTGNFDGAQANFNYFGGGAVTCPSTAGMYLAKYGAAAGAHQWSKCYGGSSNDTGWSLAVDASGNVAVTGHFQGSSNFGTATTLNSNNGSTDVFLVRYSSAGTALSAQRFGGALTDSAQGVAFDSSANALMTGYFAGQADFDGANLTSNGFLSRDIFLIKLVSLAPSTPQLTSITLTPAIASINVGATQQFTAVGQDQNGNTMSGLTFTYTSSNTTAATINSSGLATGVAAGSSMIRAQSGAVLSNQATLSVTAASDTIAPTVAITSHFNGDKVGPSLKITVGGSDNVGVARVEFWMDDRLVKTRTFTPQVPAFTTVFSFSAPAGTHVFQAKAFDAAGNVGLSALITLSVVGGGGGVSVIQSDGDGMVAGGITHSKALMVSLKQGYSQVLQFDPSVAEAAVVDLNGRKLLQQSRTGDFIAIPLHGLGNSAPIKLQSGLLLIQMRDDNGHTSIKPLVVVK